MLKANHLVTGTICLGPKSTRSCFFSTTFNQIVKVGMESMVEEEKVKDWRSKKLYFPTFRKEGICLFLNVEKELKS